MNEGSPTIKVGQKVHYQGLKGEVIASSSTDRTCLVRFDLGALSPWIDWDEVTVLLPTTGG